jgi:hypothetical protein
MKGLRWRRTDEGVVLNVRVQPKASKAEVAGVHEGRLKIKVTSPPEDGKANREVIKLLAGHFGVNKSSIRIIKGETSRDKVIEIKNLKEI